MAAPEDEMNNWRQFQGTELGSLMSSLYGNKNKPKINYPKPKSKSSIDPPKKFIPGGASLTANDPRKTTRNPVNLVVPKPTGNYQRRSFKAIDIIDRRKSSEHIQAEMDDIRMKQAHYRPAYTQPISAEAEKERLSQICTYKGGKGLPQELTFPVGEMPLEMAARKKEEERRAALRAKRGMAPKRSQANRTPLSEMEQFAQQIQGEIEERNQHLQDMKELGVMQPNQERQLKNEIARKVEELKSLDI